MSASTVARHDEAVALLHALSGPDGIHASLSATANYRAVFTRDAVMAGVAGILLGDHVVTAALARTLERLRDFQGPEGQIASNYDLRPDEPPHVSFGTLVPRIDAATWYLTGVTLGARGAVIDRRDFHDSARAVARLLDALEYNGRHLIYVPPGGNWADEYVTDGYVLYDQVLRAWALRLAGEVYDEPRWREKSAAIGRAIEAHYWPPREDGERRRWPLAAFSPVATRDLFDLAACALLALSGIAPRMAGEALDWVAERFLSRGELPPAFHPVIDETHPDWAALRRYHLYDFRNRPHEYHNGGVWPIWLGWLALALAAGRRDDDLDRLREIVRARLDAAPDFAFDEYLHGVTGAPGGTPRMAYTATGLVFLEAAVSLPAARLFA